MKQIIKQLEEERKILCTTKKDIEIKIAALDNAIKILEGFGKSSINSVQKIKPILLDKKKIPKKMHEVFAKKNPQEIIMPVKIDPKIVRMTKTPLGKRFRRTNAEIAADKEIKQPKSVQKIKKKAGRSIKYPEEMRGFIERHMETTPNRTLYKLLNEKFEVDISKDKLKSYMRYNGLKRKKVVEVVKKKVGKPKTYTEEVMNYLRDNIDKFSNKEICKELGLRFDIKVKVSTLGGVLTQHGIKRNNEDSHPEITKFIEGSKSTDPYEIRDAVIEKFEINLNLAKIRGMMKKEDPAEVKKEVKRITKLRDEDDDGFDEMGLD